MLGTLVTDSKTGRLLGLSILVFVPLVSLLGLLGITLFSSALSVHSWNMVSRLGLYILRVHMKTVQRRAIGMIKELKKI